VGSNPTGTTMLTPNKTKIQASNIKPETMLYMHVDRWNGYHNIWVKSVNVSKDKVEIITDNNISITLASTAFVLAYDKWPWWDWSQLKTTKQMDDEYEAESFN
jgi:hypothetical protein